MDINLEVQEYETKVAKMISEGGLGVSAYYHYENPRKEPTTKDPQAADAKINTSRSSST